MVSIMYALFVVLVGWYSYDYEKKQCWNGIEKVGWYLLVFLFIYFSTTDYAVLESLL